MRLIDVDTYEICQFFDDSIPKYAILSHTWGPEEVTFQEMTELQAAARNALNSKDEIYSQISLKQGYEKIMYTCRQAKDDELGWAWVDTCCIDKTSSAELSEAINSMYQWYAKSSVCYAYLPDIPQPVGVSKRRYYASPLLKTSRWFTRGWTLQELIAPHRMEFFGQGWYPLGSRVDLRIGISDRTNIPQDFMAEEHHRRSRLNTFSVAQKMSWAASRKCTRIEDSAYCLFGIFDINMPLLYGEGEKAFLRLQEEIFRATDDHSLFAWTVNLESDYWTAGSVFAKSPSNFSHSGNIVRLHEEVGAPSLLTKKGIQISLHIKEEARQKFNYRPDLPWQTSFAILNCGEKGVDKTKRILLLVANPNGNGQGIRQSGCYSRLRTHRHLGVESQEDFIDPSGFETIFLQTHRSKFSVRRFRGMTQLSLPVHVHVQNISFDCINAKQDRIDRVAGYTVKEVTYLTDGAGAYKSLDPDNIINRSNFFILRLHFHSNSGMPPLEARCGFQRYREGRGHVRLWLESKSEVRPSRTGQASQHVNIEHFKGDLISASLRLGSVKFTVAIQCAHCWDKEPERYDIAKHEKRVHFHIHVSSRLVSSTQPYQDLTELSHRTWRTHDFFYLFERTNFFLVKKEKEHVKKEQEKRVEAFERQAQIQLTCSRIAYRSDEKYPEYY